MTYDKVLTSVGAFGWYQKRAYLILSAFAMPSAFQATYIVFNFANPPFRCAVPGLPNDTFHIQNEAHSRLVNASIPWDSDAGHYSHCQAYGDLLDQDGGHGASNESRRTVACHRWVYEPDIAVTTMVPGMDLVCEREIYKKHMTMVMLLGLLIGSFFGGPLADRFGRKKLIYIPTAVMSVIGIGFGFSTSVWVALGLRVVVSMCGMIGFISIFVLVAEIVAPDKRTLATMGTMLAWSIGMLIIPVVDYFIADWRFCQVVLCMPGLLLMATWWLIPESPRWLLIKNRTEEVKVIVRIIAKVNGNTVPDELDAMLTEADEDEDEKKADLPQAKVSDLFTSRLIVGRILILAFSWCTLSMVYYGLTLGVGDLVEGSLHVNFALQGVMEFIAYTASMLLMEKVGRKKLYCGAILMSGLACLGSAGPVFAGADIPWLSIALFCMGKLGVTGAFSIIYVLTAELLPTVVRNSGMGMCSFIGRIGGIVSPYIASVGELIPGPLGQVFPLFVFGLFSVVAGLSALSLPETRNRKLPETIEDMKNFGKPQALELNIQEEPVA